MNLNLKKILLNGENKTQEFKASFSKKVTQTLTAFANTHGGTVYEGIEDDGTIKGIDIGKETLQNWQNQIKLNTQPSIFPDIDVAKIKNKNIACLTIQEHPM